ncbi:hypothetical protein HELRODRAFT_165527 [Helobdella robusta]|uniref:Uncharacterized protein n=1 Tax=Helobdella robusta TaxID=6412 RepID=T1EWZ0_HELRO|nr:hypothetical protein HELRODRAFT_165527 [Helobdella robusta]ESN91488.1 hypothetical protein HELRODRAFT_165527 [Helobdella robusta]
MVSLHQSGWLDKINDKYLKKILQRDPFTKDEIIMEVYQQIALQQHYESVYGVDMSSSLQLYRPEIIEKLPSEPASPENANNPSVGTVEDVVARLIMSKRRRYLSAASTDNEEDQPLTGWGGGQYGVYNTVMGLPPHVAKHLQVCFQLSSVTSKIIRRLSTSPVDNPLITAPNSIQLRKMMIKAPTKDVSLCQTNGQKFEGGGSRFIKGQSGFTSNINTPIVNRSRAESLEPPATLLAPHTAAIHYTPRYQQRRPTSSHGIIHPHVPHTVITPAERKRSSSGGGTLAGSGSLGNPGERMSSIGKSPISLQYINEEQEQPQQPVEESPLKAYNRKMEMEEEEMEKLREEDKGEKDGKKEKNGDGDVGTESDGDDGDHSGVSGVGGEVKVRTPLKRQDAGERAPKQKTDEKSL